MLASKRQYAAIMSPLSATLLRSSKQKKSSVEVASPPPPPSLAPAPPPSAEPVYAVSMHAVMREEPQAALPQPPPDEPHGLAVSYLKDALDRALADPAARAADLAELFCIAYSDLQRRAHSTLLPETRLPFDRKLDLDLRKVEIPYVALVELPYHEEELESMVEDLKHLTDAEPEPSPVAYHLPPSNALLEMLRMLPGDETLRHELVDRLHGHVADVFFAALRHHHPVESVEDFRRAFPSASAELPGGACAKCEAPQSVFHARFSGVCRSLEASKRTPCQCPPRRCALCDITVVVIDLYERLIREPRMAWDCLLQCDTCKGTYCPFSAFNTQALAVLQPLPPPDTSHSSHDDIRTMQEGVIAAVAESQTSSVEVLAAAAAAAAASSPVCTCYGNLAPYRPGALGDISEAAAANFGVMRVQPQNVAQGTKQTHRRDCPLSTSHHRPRQQSHRNRGANPEQPPRPRGRPPGIKSENP